MGRIRDAEKSVGSIALAPPATPLGDGTSEVEQFIRENHLDDGAAKALRSAAPEVQSEVVNRGTLLDCTNPSSAVMGRIREAKVARSTASGTDHRRISCPPPASVKRQLWFS